MLPVVAVVLDKTHPLYGSDCKDRRVIEIDVHGGITFAGELFDCGWCVGFDMAHAEDFSPFDVTQCIRTEAECITETNKLAEQLKKLAE